MASGRAPIVVGILAITGGIAWFALRTTSDAPTPSPGSQAQGPLTATGSNGKAAIAAPQTPSLTGSGSTGATPALPEAPPEKPSHRAVFVAQTRDNDWADRTEDVLKDRVRALKVTTVSGIDCRSTECELTLGGPAKTVEANMAKLEAGLATTAKALLFGKPERSDDSLTIRVYAMFER